MPFLSRADREVRGTLREETNARGGEATGICSRGERERTGEKLEAAITIDAARRAVLLVVEHAAIARREAAMIEGAHGADLVMDAGFAAFEPEGLTAGDLAIANACGDSVLLVHLALGNVVVAGRHLRLRKSRSTEKCCSKCNRREFHGVPSFRGP